MTTEPNYAMANKTDLINNDAVWTDIPDWIKDSYWYRFGNSTTATWITEAYRFAEEVSLEDFVKTLKPEDIVKLRELLNHYCGECGKAK